MSAILTVQNLEKSFGTRRVLSGVSFAVHEGDRIGLVGLNGAGKSTLLRIVVGSRSGGDGSAGAGPGGVTHEPTTEDYQADAGLVTRKRDLSLEYVAQEPRLDGTRTVMETLREGLRGLDETRRRIDAVEAEIARLGAEHRDETIDSSEADQRRLHQLLVDQAALHERVAHLGGWDQDHEIRGLAAALSVPPFDRPVSALSIGERRRVAIARALLAHPDLLALDEPTNHLDARTVEWLEGRLREWDGALLLVTHDRYFLDRVATRILEVDRGKVYSYEGNYSRFMEKQAERLADETSKERARASFVRRELDWIRRGPQARTTKQQARIDRFDAAVAAKPQSGDLQRGPMSLRLPTGGRLGKTILEAHGLAQAMGGRTLFRDLELILKPGDRIGIVGENGAGKTTLVRTLLGQLPPSAGEVKVGLNTRFAFLDQGRAELNENRTVLEEVAGGDDQVFLEDGPVHVRTFLRMMLFDDGFADTPVGVLSGGERNRVQLAKLLRIGANLLVLDEPTNDLDLMTLGVLEEALVDFPGCALIVSHDRWFLDRVATAILAFEPDDSGVTGGGAPATVTLYEGNYSDWLPRRRQLVKKAAPVTEPEVVVTTVTAPAAAKARRLSFKEKRELESIEGQITEAEARVEALQAELNDPGIYKERAAEVPRLIAACDAARTQVEQLYARWQELEALPR